MCRLLATECAGFSSQAPSECREIGEQGRADSTRQDACFIYYDGCIATCLWFQQYGDYWPYDGGVDAGDAATQSPDAVAADGGAPSVDAASAPGLDAGVPVAPEASASTD